MSYRFFSFWKLFSVIISISQLSILYSMNRFISWFAEKLAMRMRVLLIVLVLLSVVYAQPLPPPPVPGSDFGDGTPDAPESPDGGSPSAPDSPDSSSPEYPDSPDSFSPEYPDYPEGEYPGSPGFPEDEYPDYFGEDPGFPDEELSGESVSGGSGGGGSGGGGSGGGRRSSGTTRFVDGGGASDVALDPYGFPSSPSEYVPSQDTAPPLERVEFLGFDVEPEPVLNQEPRTTWVWVVLGLLVSVLITGGIVYYIKKTREVPAKVRAAVTYVKQMIAQGYPKDSIKARMLASGYRPEDINMVFSKV